MQAPVTLIKGDKIGVETDYRDAIPVNMYAVAREILGASGYMLSFPGIDTDQRVEEGDPEITNCRGANYNERFGAQYRIIANKMYAITPTGPAVELGTIPGSKQVSMPYSFNTQAIIADNRMFLYDPTNGFRQITDPDLGNVIDGDWIDGYYFLTDGEYLYHTDIKDETSISPERFATAEFMPDKSLGIIKTQDDKILVFGRYTTETFYNDESEGFSFSRISNRAMKIGIVATHAKVESNGKYYIVGGRKEEDLAVHVVTIGSSIKISTREIDNILSKYTDEDLFDIRMETYSEKDSVFIVIHLPVETLVYNSAIAETHGPSVAWSILKSGSGESKPYRAINFVFDPRFAGWVCGDKYSDRVGTIDKTSVITFGEINEWFLYTPFLNLETFSIDEIELETIPGRTVHEDASVAISVTTDGSTYSMEEWDMYGEPSNYGRRFIIRQGGYVSDWIGFRLRGLCRSRMAFSLFKVTYG